MTATASRQTTTAEDNSGVVLRLRIMPAIGRRLASALLGLLFLSTPALVQADDSTGVLRGYVFDAHSGLPLEGASLVLAESSTMAVSDSTGRFEMEVAPAGRYSLRISFVGYKPQVKDNLVIGYDAPLFVSIGLIVQPAPGKGIVVRDRLLPYHQPTLIAGAVTVSREEIISAPGAAGDLARSLSILPSVSKYDDRFNFLIIRGGNSTENGIWVDQIPLPSLNHFSAAGSTGGVIGMLNSEIIQSATVYLAGFPAAYPDRLSSIWDLRLREGNRDRATALIGLSVSGAEMVAETPVRSGRGSILVSARRGFLDLILDAMDVDVVPKYWDMHGKLAYDFDSSNHIDLILMYGSSEAVLSSVATAAASTALSGSTAVTTTTTGAHWHHEWHSDLASDVSLAFSNNDYDNESTMSTRGLSSWSDGAVERSIEVYTRNHWQMSKLFVMDFGWSVRRHLGWYHYDYDSRSNSDGGRIEGLFDDRSGHDWRLGSYVETGLGGDGIASFRVGCRGDYLSRQHRTHLSPRASIRLELNRRTDLTASTGIYFQPLPGILVYQRDAFEKLKTPYSRHFVAGLKRLFADNLEIQIEWYNKEYRHQPVSPWPQSSFVLDDMADRYGHFNSYDSLFDNGVSWANGVEVIIRGDLSQSRLRYLIGGSWSSVKYRDANGKVRPRLPDNRYSLAAEGFYHPGHDWTISLRWTVAGGVPYTPFDTALSVTAGSGVLNRELIAARRLPDYHSLNVRFERTFRFSSSTLTAYLSVWNLYDRENLAGYYWDVDDQTPRPMRQLGIFPLVGIKYRF